MVVFNTHWAYEKKEFIAESKADFSPYGYANIDIIKKKQRLKINVGKFKNF